ncbi:MAG: glycoside hydrolase family 15 protein [Acidobacteria bacterium]|nr:glycoside hydrolase family 15 protein [Acidobacteriota bacterium]
MRLEDLGLIGNCQFSALISRAGDVVWCCLPRFDSEPVFATLLDDGAGRFLVAPAGGGLGTQRYLPNTNVLETTFATPEGRFRLIDFAPRFGQYGRRFHPTQLIRIIEPIDGLPRITVKCEPRVGWSRAEPFRVMGSNHVRFEGFASPLRLWTDIPLSYTDGVPFALTERRHLILSWGASVEESLPGLCDRFLRETTVYWERWVKQCNVPPLFQGEVIRSALVLKLHCFEDTGAIIASTTTSIPESPGSGRTWDYRYCWLRDAYHVVGAFRNLGQFEEREQFIQYLFNIVAANPTLDLAPLYRIDGTCDLEEKILREWAGFENQQPVRIGNAAVAQKQNDIFGELVLALAPVFLDERFRAEQTPLTLDLLDRIAQRAVAVSSTPDAGIWEYRGPGRPQTFSNVMCWAAADRMARVAEKHRPEKAFEYQAAAERIRQETLSHSWNAGMGSLAATFDGADLDAALLQLAPLRFLPPGDLRLGSTIDAIWKGLARDGWLFRYHTDDGFGAPTVAFLICIFWLVEALSTLGRGEEARNVFDLARTALSPLGLLSEDYDTSTARLWGNFPQAYSHVGLIHAAFAASPPWREIL